jgi:predicted NUDIX family NTP pyrophosphohydrolase
MPKKASAGILLFREGDGQIEVFLVHPGGPFWATRVDGAWSIPKGEIEAGADALHTAKREFLEEAGVKVSGEFLPLAPLKQPSGKLVHAWAVRGDIDPASIRSNTFVLEWPPRSGRQQTFPEVDRGAWFDLATARRKLLRGQCGFVDALQTLLAGTSADAHAKGDLRR